MADKTPKKDDEKKENPRNSKGRNHAKGQPQVSLTDSNGVAKTPNLYHTTSSDPNNDQEKKVVQLWKAHTIKTKQKHETHDAKQPNESKRDQHEHQHQHHRKSEVKRDRKPSEEQEHEQLAVNQDFPPKIPPVPPVEQIKNVKPITYKVVQPEAESPIAVLENEQKVPKPKVRKKKKKRSSANEPLLRPPPPIPIPPVEQVSSKTSDPERSRDKEEKLQGQEEQQKQEPDEILEGEEQKAPKKVRVKSDMINENHRKIMELKTPHMSRLLHILDRFHEPQKDKDGKGELLSVLQRFGIPPQNALLALLLKDDARPFHFGNFVKLMFSPNLRTYAPINTANSYLPISKYKPAVSAIRYKGVKMRPDEFVNTENLKTAKRHAELNEMKHVCEDSEHFEFLKDLTLQQMSSLPITIMYEILNEQIKVVEKYHESYTKAFGSSSQNTKVAQAHLTLMQKHLQSLEFLGLRPLPPISVLRKFEQPPGPENSDFTSSSSSESQEDELEESLRQGDGPTYEEILLDKRTQEENKVLDGDVPA